MQPRPLGGIIARFPGSTGQREVPKKANPLVAPVVGVIMGSRSDWETMMHAVQTLEDLGVPHEARVVSAHRTPDLLFEYAEAAQKRGALAFQDPRRHLQAVVQPRVLDELDQVGACHGEHPTSGGVPGDEGVNRG